MTTRPNPALYEEPIDQPMKAVPLALRESLFGWLERTGRFKSNEIDEIPVYEISRDLDDILEPDCALESEEEAD